MRSISTKMFFEGGKNWTTTGAMCCSAGSVFYNVWADAKLSVSESPALSMPEPPCVHLLRYSYAELKTCWKNDKLQVKKKKGT